MEFNELKLYEIEVTLFWKGGDEAREMWGYRWNRGQTRVLPFVKEPFTNAMRLSFSPWCRPKLRRFVEWGSETEGLRLADQGSVTYYAPWTPYIDEFDKDEWAGGDTASDKFHWRCGHARTDEGLEIFWRCAREESRPFSSAETNLEKWKDADEETLKRLGYYW
jgi:hypothetical protein